MKRLVALLAVAGILLTIGGPAEASSPSPPLGLFTPSSDSGSFTNVGAFPVHPTWALYFSNKWNGLCFPSSYAAAAWNHGTKLFVKLETWDWSLTDIAQGKHDAALRSWAYGAAKFGHPFQISFDHEMNGGWYPWGGRYWTASQYIAAWRHVHNLIEGIAPGAIWVWNPNVEYHASGFAKYWPGSSYVDVVGLDGYYWHDTDYYNLIFRPSIRDAHALTSKPIEIAETGILDTISSRAKKLGILVRQSRYNGLAALDYFDFHHWALSGGDLSAFVYALTH